MLLVFVSDISRVVQQESVLFHFVLYFWQFVMTKSHSKVLSDMLESHAVHDFCLVGPKVRAIIIIHIACLLSYLNPVIL